MANQDKNKSDSVAPANIPEGASAAPGIQGKQDLSSTATPNAEQKPGTPAERAAATKEADEAPKGKQWYRIKGPGGVKLNGVFYQEGAELQIAAADAQSIDGYLEVFTPEHL